MSELQAESWSSFAVYAVASGSPSFISSSVASSTATANPLLMIKTAGNETKEIKKRL